MPILVVMLNNDIKASAEYSEYLKKAVGGSTLTVKGGKGLLSKKGVKIVTKEVYESEQMDDLGDSEETEEEEVVPLKAQKASKYDFCIQPHSKGSGKGSVITLEVPDELVHRSSNKGAGMNLEVPDESDSSSSSSSSDSEVVVEDISSDEDEVTKKTD
ncbi:hypothetical protein Tco_0274147, partial [Tanacetum coccineum]